MGITNFIFQKEKQSSDVPFALSFTPFTKWYNNLFYLSIKHFVLKYSNSKQISSEVIQKCTVGFGI